MTTVERSSRIQEGQECRCANFNVSKNPELELLNKTIVRLTKSVFKRANDDRSRSALSAQLLKTRAIGI